MSRMPKSCLLFALISACGLPGPADQPDTAPVISTPSTPVQNPQPTTPSADSAACFDVAGALNGFFMSDTCRALEANPLFLSSCQSHLSACTRDDGLAMQLFSSCLNNVRCDFGSEFYASEKYRTCAAALTRSLTPACNTAVFTPPERSFKLVLITRAEWIGDFREGATDPLQVADQRCQLAAESANLHGTWKAWLSTSRVNAVDRVNGQGPWKNLRGETVFLNRATLVTGALTGIRYDERGDEVAEQVWTGTKVNGQLADTNCDDWTNADNSAYSISLWPRAVAGGAASPDALWTNSTNGFCNDTKHLVCFEQ